MHAVQGERQNGSFKCCHVHLICSYLVTHSSLSLQRIRIMTLSSKLMEALFDEVQKGLAQKGVLIQTPIADISLILDYGEVTTKPCTRSLRNAGKGR